MTTPLARKLPKMANVEVTEGVSVQEVFGKGFVEGVRVRTPDGDVREIAVKGVFVKLPRTPNSQLVREWIDCDDQGHVIVDASCATSWPVIRTNVVMNAMRIRVIQRYS